MNKEDKITFEDLANWLDKPLSNNDIDLINFILTSIENRYKHLELQQKVNQLETNIKDSIERHKETIQDTKDFYRPLEDTIYSGSTLIELAETHIEILERGKE